MYRGTPERAVHFHTEDGVSKSATVEILVYDLPSSTSSIADLLRDRMGIDVGQEVSCALRMTLVG